MAQPWSRVLCHCPHLRDANTASRGILQTGAGLMDQLGTLFEKDINSIFGDLIPSVVLPKLSLSCLNIAIALSSSGWESLRLIADGLK